jgi:hypothetical protein
VTHLHRRCDIKPSAQVSAGGLENIGSEFGLASEILR